MFASLICVSEYNLNFLVPAHRYFNVAVLLAGALHHDLAGLVGLLLIALQWHARSSIHCMCLTFGFLLEQLGSYSMSFGGLCMLSSILAPLFPPKRATSSLRLVICICNNKGVSSDSRSTSSSRSWVVVVVAVAIVLTVVLNKISSTSSWYTSTRRLQPTLMTYPCFCNPMLELTFKE